MTNKPLITQTPITNLTYKGVDISITELTIVVSGIKLYRLVWNDGCANEWVEVYPALSLALARVAALTACEDGDGLSFPHDKDEFAIVATAFLHGVAR